jgi:flagellar biosynthesis regulator FlaF
MPKIGGRRVNIFNFITIYIYREKQEPMKKQTKNFQRISQDVNKFLQFIKYKHFNR